jgi:DNA helicase-2/ATP-dependent DNA helicase PcrA
MSLHVLNPTPTRRRLRDPDDLGEALGLGFSDEQLAAITAPLEPGVIIAGAGSGKTTVMAARVVWLVGSGAVRPEEVLGLTFTRKAAAELSDRVRIALVRAGVVDGRGVDESGEQLVMTYDAFAGRLVAEHGLRLGFEADPTLVSGATRFRLASRVVAAAAGPFEFISRLRPATVTERVLKLDGDLQQHLVPVTELDAHAREHLLGLRGVPLNNRGNVYADVKRAVVAAEERLELASLVADYQRLKARLGVVEFADQMALAARLAVEVPEVSAEYRTNFRVVLLDEYQDTSSAQASMLRGLFSGPTVSDGQGHPVTAVGDPFQAIYGWRGAAASNIVAFAADFPREGGVPSRRFALTVNRRSGPTILTVANVLSAPLRAQSTSGPASADQGRDDSTNGSGLLYAPPGTPAGEVRAATFDSWPEEVSWIGDQVVTARADGTAARWADIAVLTRRNADIAPLYAALTSRDVPVEIVGLGGLLHLPEIADITAILRLIEDVTANPDLIRVLTGPRWRIGPRDLALLGRRAKELAAHPDGPEQPGSVRAEEHDLNEALGLAAAETDPSDLVCLLDAVESPGDRDYSPPARQRLSRLAGELAYLRRHGEEPVLDLIRRVITTIGLDVEVMATPEFTRTARRDQLGAFLDAVADYVDVDGDASLSGLLAWLQAEIDQGAGLEQSVPSDREAVKLLTVHKAKGLEWEVVFLPALVKGVFPSERVTDNWITTPAALPADLRGDAAVIPQLAEASVAAMSAYKRQLAEQQQLAEDRLAYVAATRAKRLLVGSGHWWRADLVRSREKSAYLEALLAEAERSGQVLATADPPTGENPLVTAVAPQLWPAPLDAEGLASRRAAAALVEQFRERTGAGATPAEEAERARRSGSVAQDPLLLDDEAVVTGWDADLDRLLAELVESRSGRREIGLPDTLSASALLALAADPDQFTADLARPMPRPPSRAARFGTRFHSWIEHHFSSRLPAGQVGQRQLVDPDELTDRADAASGDDAELRELCRAFAAGRFGETTPYAIEAPFTLLVGGRLIRGRIDAVYEAPPADAARDLPAATPQPRHRFQVVDWKTGRRETADPLQLAVYRLAWAEVTGVQPEEVDAVFYYVRTDRVVRPDRLPGRAELNRLLLGSATG